MWTRRLCENSHYEHPSHEHNVDEINSCSFALLSVTASNSILWGSLHGRVISMVLSPFLAYSPWVEFPLSIEWNAVFTDSCAFVECLGYLGIQHRHVASISPYNIRTSWMLGLYISAKAKFQKRPSSKTLVYQNVVDQFEEMGRLDCF